MWNNLSGKKRFYILKFLQPSSGVVGVIVALPLLLVPFPELWMRFVFAFSIGFVAFIAMTIFVHWMSPNCPHCGAKLSAITRWQTFSACPHCGGKFDEPM